MVIGEYGGVVIGLWVRMVIGGIWWCGYRIVGKNGYRGNMVGR